MLITAFFSVFLMIGSIIIAGGAQAYHTETTHAVVTESIIPTFIDEGNTAKNNLTEGTRVELIDRDSSEYILVENQLGDEYLVKYADLRFI